MQLKLTPNVAAEQRAYSPAGVRAWQAREDRRQAAHRDLMHLTAAQQELRLDVAAGRQRIAQIDPRFQRGAVEREEARIAPLEAEIARLQGQIDRVAAVFRAEVAVCTACAELYGKHLDGRLRDLPLPKVEKSAGGWPAGVEKQRQARAAGDDRRAALERAGRTVAEVVDQVRAHFAELREKGRPGVAYLLRPGGSVNDIRWPVERTEWKRPGTGNFDSALAPDVVAIIAALPKAGAELEASVIAAVEAEAKKHGGEALTDAERARLLAELEAEILQIERVEEAMIRAAEAEGLEILRRADADPRAVLSVEACAAQAAAPGPAGPLFKAGPNGIMAVAGGE